MLLVLLKNKNNYTERKVREIAMGQNQVVKSPLATENLLKETDLMEFVQFIDKNEE
jgi:hypothetical protein